VLLNNCHVHFHSVEVARFLFARWRVWAHWTHWTRASGSFLSPRGFAGGQTYKRIAVLVDNCCACLVFCW